MFLDESVWAELGLRVAIVPITGSALDLSRALLLRRAVVTPERLGIASRATGRPSRAGGVVS